MDDVFDVLTPQKPPKVTDPGFFSPGGYAHVTIRRDAKGLYAQAERADHKGPEVLRAANLRGMNMALRNLGWPPDDIYSEVPIPMAEMPEIEAGGVPLVFKSTLPFRSWILKNESAALIAMQIPRITRWCGTPFTKPGKAWQP